MFSGDIAQPVNRKGLLKSNQEQSDLHCEVLLQEGEIYGLQRILERQTVLASLLVEPVLKFERLLDVKMLRRRHYP
jgi:hypothetical protein